jgi:GNAT superfamily N-acetyltransferase
MSLYTFSHEKNLPAVKKPHGLTILESSDVKLLSMLGETTTADVRTRLANDHVAFVAYMHKQPAAFGWMARGKAVIGELNHALILPIGHRYLWNFRTLVNYRGLGIYPALLQHIIQYEMSMAERFWIVHAPENKSSLKGITKAGFEYVGKLYAMPGGETAIEATAAAQALAEPLAFMDIQLSSAAVASCWNCSSPYLKKRTPDCCCAAADTECTNNSQLLMLSH